jgi:exodeoxyribonuclease V alpha subunit
LADAVLPGALDAPSDSGIWDCIVQLTHSYRYARGSGIGRLAAAINAGDADGVAAALAVGDVVQRVDPSGDGTLGAALERMVREGLAEYFAAGDPVERLRALDRFRVLCAHRRGPYGVELVNAQIERLLADAGAIRPDAPFYPGRPILITRNDYQLQLFNGDMGVIADDADRPGSRVAFFLAPDGTPRRFAPSRLPPHETAFAMSVHKSQGSEFDSVAVVLPEQPSPVVTRELLYTAITRARQRVTLFASAAMVAHAVTHRTERASGLREALWDR